MSHPDSFLWINCLIRTASDGKSGWKFIRMYLLLAASCQTVDQYRLGKNKLLKWNWLELALKLNVLDILRFNSIQANLNVIQDATPRVVVGSQVGMNWNWMKLQSMWKCGLYCGAGWPQVRSSATSVGVSTSWIYMLRCQCVGKAAKISAEASVVARLGVAQVWLSLVDIRYPCLRQGRLLRSGVGVAYTEHRLTGRPFNSDGLRHSDHLAWNIFICKAKWQGCRIEFHLGVGHRGFPPNGHHSSGKHARENSEVER